MKPHPITTHGKIAADKDYGSQRPDRLGLAMTVSSLTHESSTAPSHTPDAEAEFQVCRRCFRELPLHTFRFRCRATGVRHRTCQVCFNRYRREQLLPQHRASRLSKHVTELTSAESQDEVRLLAAVVRRMIRRFGGFEAMCDEWAANVQAAARRRPGHQFVLRTFQAIAQLATAVEHAERMQDRTSRQELAGLTDQQLAELVFQQLPDFVDDGFNAAELPSDRVMDPVPASVNGSPSAI